MNVGFDGGFFATKAVTDGKETVFPSFAVKPVESLMSLNGHETIIVESERTGSLLVGKEAVKKGSIGARQETAGWVRRPEFLGMFYRALSDLTAGKNVSVNLVTGLPLTDYRQEQAVMRAILQGEHVFLRLGRYRQRFTVDKLRIVPQAWGAVLYRLFDDRGRLVERGLLKERVAVVDIGGRTVNYLSVDGLSDIPAQSRGTNRGAWNVMRHTREFFAAEHPELNRLQDHQIMTAILGGEIYDADERVDLTPVISPIVSEIGREIIDTATQYWGARAATHRRVFVIGGGAHLWGEQIKAAFPQAAVFDNPEMINARGFYRFACCTANQ